MKPTHAHCRPGRPLPPRPPVPGRQLAAPAAAARRPLVRGRGNVPHQRVQPGALRHLQRAPGAARLAVKKGRALGVACGRAGARARGGAAVRGEQAEASGKAAERQGRCRPQLQRLRQSKGGGAQPQRWGGASQIAGAQVQVCD
jgi:hypothetical protein